MHRYDLTPLFRTSIGFDRMSRLFDAALQHEHNHKKYPPYNITKSGENDYQISIAVAGFGPEDLEVELHENTLTVRGRIQDPEEQSQFLHRGIASRSFERRFQLADHIRVTDARMDHGLLHIELVREVPEALKPRQIAIRQSAARSLDVA